MHLSLHPSLLFETLDCVYQLWYRVQILYIGVSIYLGVLVSLLPGETRGGSHLLVVLTLGQDLFRYLLLLSEGFLL